jgi:aminoglycoside phosphotransferase family enzyme/predicted kinase
MPAGPAPRLLLDGHAELRETHISWVFVAADRAYKVKKPIVLPFLDYGTLARRLAMCEAEVELNRRLAPDVYLGVRALVPAPGGVRLAEPGDPAAVEYAVEMARYDEADTLAARLAAGTAGAADIAAVGARLAAFHDGAEACAGGAEAFKRAVDDNFATLHGVAPDRAAIARAERSAGAQLAARWDDLDARGAAGLVRDGHGDLRLEHILLGDRIRIVDCVEFDPALRRTDVGTDLAFLVMELHEAGRGDLAGALVAAYRDAGGDPGDDALLAAFAAYRAEVRAKVSLERAAQLAGAPADAKRARAARLLALGTRLRWAAAAPLVIAVAGLSASGKTTVAHALAGVTGFAQVNSDVVRKRRAGIAPERRAPARLYRDEVSRDTYGRLGRYAATHAADGVIVDATFRRRADRDAFRTTLGATAPALFVECRAPAAVLEARARTRGPGVSDAGVEIVRRQLAEAEPLDDIAPDAHVVVRSDRPIGAIVGAIADAVDATVVRHAQTRISCGVATPAGCR